MNSLLYYQFLFYAYNRKCVDFIWPDIIAYMTTCAYASLGLYVTNLMHCFKCMFLYMLLSTSDHAFI